MREPQARREHREITVPTRDGAPRARRRAPASLSTRVAATAGTIGRTVLRHPGEILGVGAVLGAVSLICLNALGYQSGRHPAPIFPKPPARGVTADKPRPMPAAPESPRMETARAEAGRAGSEKSEALKVEPPARTPRDGIGDIIRGGDPKHAETTASVAGQGTLSIAQAQRALNTLGYGPLKVDGVIGTGTRAAFEKFERDRKLPVRGEPSPRTLRELAARAGATRG